MVVSGRAHWRHRIIDGHPAGHLRTDSIRWLMLLLVDAMGSKR